MSANWNVSATRFLLIGVLLALCAFSILARPAGSASAAAATPALSCYGGASYFTVTTGTYGSNQIGPYYTTSRCNDINLRLSGISYDMPVCVIFVRHTSSCNHITDIPPGDSSWHVIASNVKDGTAFKVDFFGCISPLCVQTDTISGYVAY